MESGRRWEAGTADAIAIIVNMLSQKEHEEIDTRIICANSTKIQK